MFAGFLSSLLGPSPAVLSAPDARLALAALLVRVARSDGHAGPDEIAHVERVLARRYGLTLPEAAALRREAEGLEREAPDTVRFTRALKEAVPEGERAALLETLWSVALADGQRAAEEDALIRLVASLLGISDRDSALARQRAARG
ncbi:MAG: TerB family tellurite resistance protein [Rhodobacteraceae bacterium]|nr:TerB family tellurite resistance protein [Paracoccaceae bacterium]